MNRSIKFRAWHAIAKQMFSAETMAEDQLTLLTTGQFINVSGTSTKLSKIIHAMIPLQYTGTRDKNGVEIYEGDIIRSNDELQRVFFNEATACFDVEYEGGDCEPLIQNELAEDIGCEVIGNIYENPELLNIPA